MYKNLGPLGDCHAEVPAPPYTDSALTMVRAFYLRNQYSLRFRLQQGAFYTDPGNGYKASRVELYCIRNNGEIDYIEPGEYAYVGLSLTIPSTFPNTGPTGARWHKFLQLKGSDLGGPRLSLGHEGSADLFTLNGPGGVRLWKTPIADLRGKTTHLVVGFRNSPETSVSLAVNDNQAWTGPVSGVTPPGNGRIYVKYGLYRDDRPETSTVDINGPWIADDYVLADPFKGNP